jgi:DNA-binding NtrC family response regulator
MSSSSNYRVLLIDDDLEFHQIMRFKFGQQYLFDGVHTIEKLEQTLQKNEPYDLFLLDMVLDASKPEEKSGLAQIPKIQGRYPSVPIIVITKDLSDAPAAADAFRAGVKDYIFKSLPEYDLWKARFENVIKNSKLEQENRQLKAEVKRIRKKEDQTHQFIGESAKIQEIKRILKALSQNPNITVLLTGETGVGKEVAARYLHRHGARADKPFQAVNLSMIQESMLESRLFGHKKGAFTGADRDMEGYFSQTDTGVLMLDEFGELNKELQVKLLRFLEDKTIRPLGANKDIRLDVQIITATNRDLAAEVQKGNFREDLFYRINAFTIKIPPLRERKEDIPNIITHHLQANYNLEEVKLDQFIEAPAFRKLLDYHWPGNIRELKNAVDFMIVKKGGKARIDESCLPEFRMESPVIPSNGAGISGSTPTPVFSAESHSGEKEKALIDLRTIESYMIIKNKVKKDVAEEMKLSLDQLRYKVETIHKRFPDLLAQFPYTAKAYPKIVNF